MANKTQTKPEAKKGNDNGKMAAAAVGGAVIGAATAAMATKVLSDPKNRKKVQTTFDNAKDQIMSILGDLQSKMSEAGEDAKDKVLEGKVEAQKALKAGKKKLSK